MFRKCLISMFKCPLVGIFVTMVACQIEPMENIGQRSIVKCVLAIADEHFATGDILTLATVNRERDFLRTLGGAYRWSMFVHRAAKKETYLFDSASRKKTQNYIIVLKKSDDLNEILDGLKRAFNWNPFARFIVLSKSPAVSVANLTQTIGLYRILNVIFVLPISLSTFSVYSWYPYANGSCADRFNETQLVNRCQDGALADRNMNLFPEKVPNNLQGCYVKARPIRVAPYVILPKNLDRTKTNLNLTEGLEIQLLNTVAEVANFTLNYTISTKEIDVGLIIENKSTLLTSGLMKSLVEGQVDIGMGCLTYSPIRHKYLSFTLSYMHDHLVWCVPYALRQPKWKCLFNIFHWTIWALTFVTLILAALCLWAFGYNRPTECAWYRDLQACITNTLAVFLSISPAAEPRNGYMRIFFMIWIIFSLHMTLFYQTYLISVLTHPSYEKQITTLDELFESKVPYGLPAPLIRYFENQSDWRAQKVFKELVVCKDPMDCLNSIAYDRNYGFGYLRQFLQYNQGNFIDADGKSRMYIFKDNIAVLPVIMILSEEFPLIQRINNLLSRIAEAGLIEFWSKQLLWKQKINSNTMSETQKLSLYNVQGAFFILVIGLGTASIAFTVESIIQKCKRQR